MHRRGIPKGYRNWTRSNVKRWENLRINNFKINGFGKLQNKEIELQNGINVILGENESGKSSMLKFISSMFYGDSKNKNGKDI